MRRQTKALHPKGGWRSVSPRKRSRNSHHQGRTASRQAQAAAPVQAVPPVPSSMLSVRPMRSMPPSMICGMIPCKRCRHPLHQSSRIPCRHHSRRPLRRMHQSPPHACPTPSHHHHHHQSARALHQTGILLSSARRHRHPDGAVPSHRRHDPPPPPPPLHPPPPATPAAPSRRHPNAPCRSSWRVSKSTRRQTSV